LVFSVTSTKELLVISSGIDFNVRFLTNHILQSESKKTVTFVLVSVRGGILLILEVDTDSKTVKTRQDVIPGKCLCGCVVPSIDG
jgi:hypothetical protein